MSTFPPGLWKLDDELTDSRHFVISDVRRDGCILIERHIEGYDSEDLPVAHLVAAAPDLLCALKRVLETTPHWIGPQGDFIRAAIAKAEGEV